MSAIPTSEEKTITADWTESTPMYTGIMYVRYNTFSGYILDKIFATYDDGTVEEFSSSSFALADDIGAVVTATYKYVEDQTIVVDTWVEPYPPSDSNGGKEPPADEPEPEEGIGNGSGDGEGDGNSGGKTPGNGGTDPKGEDNTGTGINPVPKPTTPVSNPVSVPNVTITPDAAAQVTVPAAEAAEQTPQQPEEPETVEPEAAPDSGGDGEVIEEPEPENVVTNLFEVLSKTMQENPILALLLLLLLLIVIIIAGYSRYRKSKQ